MEFCPIAEEAFQAISGKAFKTQNYITIAQQEKKGHLTSSHSISAADTGNKSAWKPFLC